MICSKCGIQNIPGASKCSGCSAPMPPTQACGGFGDILNFENFDATVPAVASEGSNTEDMKNLLRKTDNVIKQNDRNARISVIAAAISIVVLICSIVFGMITMNKIDEVKAEINALAVKEKDSESVKEKDKDKDKDKDSSIIDFFMSSDDAQTDSAAEKAQKAEKNKD